MRLLFSYVAVKTKIHQKMVPIDDKGNQLNTIRLGGGPPLVMIHGFGAAIGFWACNLDAFARHHTVYAFDLLGFGRSSRPRVTAHTAEEAEDVLVESIEAWRKSVGLDSFTLLGTVSFELQKLALKLILLKGILLVVTFLRRIR